MNNLKLDDIAAGMIVCSREYFNRNRSYEFNALVNSMEIDNPTRKTIYDNKFAINSYIKEALFEMVRIDPVYKYTDFLILFMKRNVHSPEEFIKQLYLYYI